MRRFRYWLAMWILGKDARFQIAKAQMEIAQKFYDKLWEKR